MSDLGTATIRVVKASRVLADIDKLVWIEIYHLDQGPEGCYILPDTLARRIGRSRDTMERSRRRLKDAGLLYSVPRPGYCDRWHVALPAKCVAVSSRPTDEDVEVAANQLDELISQPGGNSAAKIIDNLAAHMQPSSPKPGGTPASNLAANETQPGGTPAVPIKGRVLISTESVLKDEERIEKKNETAKEQKRSPPNWIAEAKRIARERESTMAGK
ncbi:MAG: helix-turn-helix domain-containing protein [Gemmatimonadetes bacterium]|nr:helix-turn-helix domain-containing protein [Gemmatimonadota bacterium]